MNLPTKTAKVNTEKKSSGMQPSKKQQALIDIAQTGVNVIGKGVPGGGKSTTAKFVTDALPGGLVVCYMNNAREELEKKINNPKWQVSNFHKLGMFYLRGARLDKRKEYNLLEEFVEYDGRPLSWDTIKKSPGNLGTIYREQLDAFLACLSTIKHNCLDYENETVLDHLCGLHCLEEELKDFIPVVMNKNNDEIKKVTFDDMLYLPVFLGLVQKSFASVLVDEAQDLNKTCQTMACLLGEQVIPFGQREQAIMGFAGADVHALDSFRDRLDAQEVAINTCYRCDLAIIDDFNRLADDVKAEPREGAGDGLVKSFTNWDEAPNLDGTFMVLSRCKAPLFATGYRLLKEGKRVSFKGSDLMDNIMRKMKATKVNDLVDVMYRLREATDRKIEIINKSKFPSEARIQALEDEFDAAGFLAEMAELNGSRDINGLDKVVRELKRTQPNAVEFMTGHTSKGLERDNVMILSANRSRIITPTSTEDEIQQEKNVEYVMRSRAKHATYCEITE